MKDKIAISTLALYSIYIVGILFIQGFETENLFFGTLIISIITFLMFAHSVLNKEVINRSIKYNWIVICILTLAATIYINIHILTDLKNEGFLLLSIIYCVISFPLFIIILIPLGYFFSGINGEPGPYFLWILFVSAGYYQWFVFPKRFYKKGTVPLADKTGNGDGCSCSVIR